MGKLLRRDSQAISKIMLGKGNKSLLSGTAVDWGGAVFCLD